MVGTDSGGDGPDVCTARLTCLRELSAGELAGVRHRGRVAPYGKGRTSRDASSRRGGRRSTPCPRARYRTRVSTVGRQRSRGNKGGNWRTEGGRPSSVCVSVPRPTPAREREGGLLCRAPARLPRARFGRRRQTTGVEEEASPPSPCLFPLKRVSRDGESSRPPLPKKRFAYSRSEGALLVFCSACRSSPRNVHSLTCTTTFAVFKTVVHARTLAAPLIQFANWWAPHQARAFGSASPFQPN
ncbi:hypothetical protein HPB51_021546 [Rhipicephalus microplus]|uniref:Uncharacterized protein n=1 Tax=Rhipicephalus microplus TaxID=6941 RepID=A0A9J6EJ70_RHIMP|nr:hypothetical protein HPB51_021546 [Rhipicephalus microplus]